MTRRALFFMRIRGFLRKEIVITSYSIHYTKLYETGSRRSSGRSRGVSLRCRSTPSRRPR